MPFTVDDFGDLLRLLDQHPEWRSELRRHVLTDELLELPALMRQLGERVDRLAAAQERTAEQLSALTARVDALTEAQARTEARVDALTAAQARIEARLEELAAAQARTAEQLSALTARVDALAEAQVRTEARLEELAAAQARTEARLETLADRVGDLTGKVLESQYRQRAGAYFSPLARRLQVLDPARLADRLDDAVDAGQLTAGERTAVLQADIVLSGVRRDDRAEIYVVVEVSAGIGRHDVERAAQRAGLLAKLGQPVLPVVAGEWITPEAEARARLAGVWQVLDGHADPPTGRQSA